MMLLALQEMAVQAERFRQLHEVVVLNLKITDLPDSKVKELEKQKEVLEKSFEVTGLIIFNPDLLDHILVCVHKTGTALDMMLCDEQIEVTHKWVRAWCDANPHYNMIPPELVLQDTGKR